MSDLPSVVKQLDEQLDGHDPKNDTNLFAFDALEKELEKLRPAYFHKYATKELLKDIEIDLNNVELTEENKEAIIKYAKIISKFVRKIINSGYSEHLAKKAIESAYLKSE